MELTAKTSGGLGKVKKVWSAIEDNLSAILLCLAILFMFYEVLARYFFKSAVYITNEWTPFLTTWSMLIGNAILVRERGHVSIDILKNSFKSEKNKAWLDFYLSLLTLLFSIIFAWSSVQFVSNAYARDILSESMLQTPMWIPYSMMIVAGVLMGIHSVVNIIQDGAKLGKLEKWYASLTPVILVAITVVCYILIVKCSTPLITMGVLLLIMLALGLPITMALGLSTIIVIMHFDMISTASISSKLFYSINKNSLLAIPFFVVSGNIMAKGNLGKYLLDWASELLKPMQGGLPIAIILAAMVFAAISGASAASAAALAVIGLPLLIEKGYPRHFGAGEIAAGGTLAIIIPPSSLMILYACTTDVSVTDMFKAGIVPGVIIGICLILYIYFYCKKGGYGKADVGKWNGKVLWSKTKKAFWALLMPVAILGVIYGGVCTATEAAAASVIYASIVCLFIYKDIKPKDFINIFVASVKTSAFILAITMTAALFGFLVTMEQLPQMLLNLALNANLGKAAVFLIINLVLFFLGFFMTPGAIILIVVPIVLPITQALGINTVHFGIMMMINLELALLTPPVGANLYVLSSTGKMPVQDVIKGVVPFLGILIVGLIMIICFPVLSTFLL